MEDYTPALREKLQTISSVEEDLPAWVTVFRLRRSLAVEYMSDHGLRMLGTSLEELQRLGEDFLSRFANESDVTFYLNRIRQFVEGNRPGEVFTFFQQYRPWTEKEWIWFLSTLRILPGSGSEGSLLLCQSVPIYPESPLMKKVNRLLRESLFYRQHFSRYANLSRREKEILHLLANARSNKQIAETLFISVNTVETHKKNLKSKLGAETTADLIQFGRAFEDF